MPCSWGGACRESSIKDVARELHFDWQTVNKLGKQYVRAQLARASKPRPKVIGIDEISAGKGQGYRIVEGGLAHRYPIWHSESNRSESSMAAILFETVHVMPHLGQAIDTVPAANIRLNTAYLPKEFFWQLWDYQREPWARQFFENWRVAPKWLRIKPQEKFAEMIDRHWDWIAANRQPGNKESLDFFEGLNNKICIIQRRAYGLRDEKYLQLQILTCMLPPR